MGTVCVSKKKEKKEEDIYGGTDWRWVHSPHKSNPKSTNKLDSKDPPVGNDPMPILSHGCIMSGGLHVKLPT